MILRKRRPDLKSSSFSSRFVPCILASRPRPVCHSSRGRGLTIPGWLTATPDTRPSNQLLRYIDPAPLVHSPPSLFMRAVNLTYFSNSALAPSPRRPARNVLSGVAFEERQLQKVVFTKCWQSLVSNLFCCLLRTTPEHWTPAARSLACKLWLNLSFLSLQSVLKAVLLCYKSNGNCLVFLHSFWDLLTKKNCRNLIYYKWKY